MELPLPDIEILPLPEELDFDLPLPDVTLFSDQEEEFSPIMPQVKAIPSLVTLCISQLAKTNFKATHNFKYLPQHLKTQILHKMEQNHKIVPDDEIMKQLLGPNIDMIDFSKYRFLKFSTINYCINHASQFLKVLNLNHVYFDSNIYQQRIDVQFPNLQKLMLDYSYLPENLIFPILINSPRLVSLSIEHVKNISIENLLQILTTKSCKIVECNISSNYFVPERKFLNFLQSNNLKSLVLNKSSNWLSTNCLKEIADICNSSLVSLSIDDYLSLDDKDISMLVTKCTALRSLSLANCWNLSDNAIENIVVHCKNLEEFILDGCSNLTDECIFSISKFLCSKLKYLSIQDCERISSAGLEFLANTCTLLQKFDVANHDLTSFDAITQNCHDLRALRVRGNHSFLRFPVIEELTNNCKKVHTISIENNFYLNSNSVVTMVKNWNQLTSITLSNCVQLEDIAILAISKYCKNVTHLNLQNCFFSKKAISNCFNNLKQLQNVNFCGSNRFCDENLILLAKNCDNLLHVDVRDCKNVTNFGVKMLSQLCVTLETFNCSTKLDDETFQCLCNCRHLRSLKIGNASNISNNCLESLTNTQNIIDIHLVDTNISNETVQKILKNCHQLESLFLSKCPNISNEILPSLDESNCDTIYLSGSNVSPTQVSKFNSLSNRLQVIGSGL